MFEPKIPISKIGQPMSELKNPISEIGQPMFNMKNSISDYRIRISEIQYRFIKTVPYFHSGFF